MPKSQSILDVALRFIGIQFFMCALILWGTIFYKMDLVEYVSKSPEDYTERQVEMIDFGFRVLEDEFRLNFSGVEEKVLFDFTIHDRLKRRCGPVPDGYVIHGCYEPVLQRISITWYDGLQHGNDILLCKTVIHEIMHAVSHLKLGTDGDITHTKYKDIYYKLAFKKCREKYGANEDERTLKWLIQAFEEEEQEHEDHF